MSDLIDRQKIIDLLDHVIEKGLVNQFSGEHPITAEVMKRVTKALPSAEPEIIRCKDCIHYPNSNADCPMIEWTRNEDDFCSYAERRTDE